MANQFFKTMTPEMMDYWFGDSRRHHYSDKNVYGQPIQGYEKKPVKGFCRYCGKRVPHGIWMHEKSCEKRPKEVVAAPKNDDENVT